MITMESHGTREMKTHIPEKFNLPLDNTSHFLLTLERSISGKVMDTFHDHSFLLYVNHKYVCKEPTNNSLVFHIITFI